MKEVADAVCPSRTLSRTRSSLTLMHLRRTIARSSQTSSSSPASVLSMWSYSLHLLLLSQITPTAAWPVLSLRSRFDSCRLVSRTTLPRNSPPYSVSLAYVAFPLVWDVLTYPAPSRRRNARGHERNFTDNGAVADRHPI